jgi:nitroimidazol reductase NimA-like FMN-containing flavoprotein (pyridoxamine 5'-phosphate oxidase superfamily)
METDPDLVALAPERCWELLRRERLGRLAFTDRAMPVIRPLNYCLDGSRVVFRVGQRLAHRLDGQVVAFEVDEIDAAARVGSSVIITGTAHEVTQEADLLRLASTVPSWVDHEDSAAVSLTIGFLEGRELRARARRRQAG